MKKELALGLILVALVFGMIAGIAVGRAKRPTDRPVNGKPVSPTPTGAKTPTTKKDLSAKDGFSLSPPTLDLGEIMEGESRRFKIELKRPEGTPMRIGAVRTSCPCLQFVPRKFIIGPQEDCEITFDLHSLTMHGDASRKFYVEIIEPKKMMLVGDVNVRVKRVPAKLLVKPEAFRFGALRNEEKPADVTIYNLTKRRVTLKVPTSSQKSVSAVLESTTIPAGGKITVTANAAPAEKPGLFSGAVSIETDLPEHHILQIPFEGTQQR